MKAFFKVDASGLPAELRSGIFAPGGPTEYPAWIRFSNGDPDGAQAPDGKSDVRGMAVKLMNVEGALSGSQDFVLCTAKEFFSKDATDYLELHRALAKGSLALGWYALWHTKEISILNHAKVVPGSPLGIEYFSALPYKLGPTAMRFKVTPCKGQEGNVSSSPDYLREHLVSALAAGPACFDFYVQPNRDLARQPVENPMLPWDEAASPYVKVATITIPEQSEIDSEPHLNFCENLSFDPWHTLPGTRPLGQISRIRGVVYPGISEFRHQYNNVPVMEPRSLEPCAGETAALCQAPRH